MPERFGKIGVQVPVRYKFLSKEVTVTDESVHAGVTDDFSSLGIVIHGQLPPDEVLGHLLRGEVLVGLNILLPTEEEPVKALGRLDWIEADTAQPDHCHMALRFTDISKEHKDKLVRFTIKAQIKKRFGQ